MDLLPYDYIRGLVEGEGCFSFCPTGEVFLDEKGDCIRPKRPAFLIYMHERDSELLHSVIFSLGLDDKIYKRKAWRKDGVRRGNTVGFIIRDIGKLKNTIIPFFYNKLYGHKRKQFFQWLEKMNDPGLISESRFLYMLHKNGWFKEKSKDFD